MCPLREAKDVWSEAKTCAVLAAAPGRSPSNWIFPVLARKAGSYLWVRASAEAQFGKGDWQKDHLADPALRIFTPYGIPKEGDVRHFVLPLKGEADPTALRLTFPATRGGKSVRFLFEGILGKSLSHGSFFDEEVHVVSPEGGPVKNVTAFLCGSEPNIDCFDPKIKVPVINGVAKILITRCWRYPTSLSRHQDTA
ncbi:hypothetical protein BH11ARM2_BH11ARM2_05990 [soil metagenome]